MKKRNLIISWALRVLVALGFFMASLGKLTHNANVIDMFQNWGFPNMFYFGIGLLELVLAILLLIPRTLKIAIIGIAIILTGALMTHLINDPIAQTIRPLLFFVLLGIIYYLNSSGKKFFQK
jgi:uncharacterized membrane protein YphA (DoxX/SURF4 family)